VPPWQRRGRLPWPGLPPDPASIRPDVDPSPIVSAARLRGFAPRRAGRSATPPGHLRSPVLLDNPYVSRRRFSKSPGPGRHSRALPSRPPPASIRFPLGPAASLLHVNMRARAPRSSGRPAFRLLPAAPWRPSRFRAPRFLQTFPPARPEPAPTPISPGQRLPRPISTSSSAAPLIYANHWPGPARALAAGPGRATRWSHRRPPNAATGPINPSLPRPDQPHDPGLRQSDARRVGRPSGSPGQPLPGGLSRPRGPAGRRPQPPLVGGALPTPVPPWNAQGPAPPAAPFRHNPAGQEPSWVERLVLTDVSQRCSTPTICSSVRAGKSVNSWGGRVILVAGGGPARPPGHRKRLAHRSARRRLRNRFAP